jgi:hypothetical protein
MAKQCCPGCGVITPDAAGPVHAYVPASPGCWYLFCSLTDWIQALHAEDDATITQQVVDSYMVQHAANPERRNRQSVAVHLMSLCASLEHGVRGGELRNRLSGWTRRDYPELLPRPFAYEMTVQQIASAVDLERKKAVETWALSVWDAWAQHHEVVREWLAAAAS